MIPYKLTPDPWLAGYLGGEVYRFAPAENAPLDDPGPLREVQERPGPVFMYAKIPTTWLAAVQACEDAGFRLVDTNVTFDKKSEPGGPPAGYPFQVRPARPEDRAGVTDLARRSFVYSRFHLDPDVPRAVADAIKGGWVDNFFTGKRGDAMIVAAEGSRIVGFLQLLYVGADTTVIDLIAVDEAYRGRGLAGAMIGLAQREPGRAVMKVGTQAANITSMRMYEKIGFRLCETSYVLHYHNAARRRAAP